MVAASQSELERAEADAIGMLVEAGIGPRPGAPEESGRIQMKHKVSDARPVAAARAGLEAAKSALRSAEQCCEPNREEALATHYRDQVEFVIATFAQL